MRTGVKRRLRAYEEQANLLRIAWIACNNSMVPAIIDDIIKLNRRFEKEDEAEDYR